jgi:hypothetical protein
VKLADLTPGNVAVLAGLAGVVVVGLYVWHKGGIGKAVAGAGAAAVDAAGDLAVGAVGEIGAAVGLPTPAETTTDPSVARWIIDHPNGGQLEASKWAGAPAYLRAQFLAPGSGTPPPAGPLLERFPLPTTGDFARADRGTGYTAPSSSSDAAADSAWWNQSYGLGA